MRKLTAERVAQAINTPVEDWKGNCYGIACAMVRRRLVPGGVAVYGHWIGPVSKKSMFSAKADMGFCQHGWVLAKDGSIVDPTRWVFEHVDPYIYQGPNDHYDEGGNRLRVAMMGPPPDFDGSQKLVHLKLPREARNALHILFALDPRREPIAEVVLSYNQLFWLANVPPAALGDQAVDVFMEIKRRGKEALIPIDNMRMVERMAATR